MSEIGAQIVEPLPITDLGASSNSSDFFETSAVWAILHLREALTRFNAGEQAEFRRAMQKFGACAKAMLDTLPEVGS